MIDKQAILDWAEDQACLNKAFGMGMTIDYHKLKDFLNEQLGEKREIGETCIVCGGNEFGCGCLGKEPAPQDDRDCLMVHANHPCRGWDWTLCGEEDMPALERQGYFPFEPAQIAKRKIEEGAREHAESPMAYAKFKFVLDWLDKDGE